MSRSCRPPTSERPLRLLYVVSGWGAPTQTFVRREAEAAVQAGCSVEVLSLKEPAPVDHPLIVVHHLGSRMVLTGCLATVARRPLRTLRTLINAVRHSRPSTVRTHVGALLIGFAAHRRVPEVDRVHAHFAWAAATTADGLSALRGTGYSVFAHAFDVFDARYVDDYTGDKLRRASFVAVESEAIRREVDQAFGCRSVVVRMGVPPELVVPSISREERSGALVVSVGSLLPKKGHDVVLRTLPRLPSGTVLRIVGEGPERDALTRLAVQLGVADRLELPGHLGQAEVLASLDEATVFCLASRATSDGDRDGVPNVLVEAMARGVPCVSTRVSGIPDLLEPGRGVLVAPDDEDGLAEALTRVIQAPQLRDEIATTALEHVHRYYRADVNWPRLERLLRSSGPSSAGTRSPRAQRREEDRLNPRRGEHSYLQLRSLVDALRAEAALVPSGILLDIGCGAKPYKPLFKNAYLGLDLQLGHGLPDLIGTAERLPCRSGCASVVLSTQQLEHVESPGKVLAEARRVLEPGGTLLLSTHGVWPYHPDPHDYWRWTEEGLTKLFIDSGLDVVRIHRQGGLVAVITTMALYPVGALAGRRRVLRPALRFVIAMVNTSSEVLDRVVERLTPAHLASPSYLVIARRADGRISPPHAQP